MTAAVGVAAATTLLWSGMVLAISFLETPLKFRTPGVSLRIGLGIGRLVFRALNTVEIVLALVLLGAALVERPPGSVVITGTLALMALLIQLAEVRPRLARRSDLVLEGADVPRSHAHYAYVGLEVVKLSALLATGILLLSR